MRKLIIFPIIIAMLWILLAMNANADERINENLVKIYVTCNEPSYQTPWQMNGSDIYEGSGCIIGENLILTNAHVISDQTFIRVKRSGQTKKYVATVRFVAHECDLALLEVHDNRFFPESPPLEIGELPLVGDEIAVYGYPSYTEQLTVTKGIVSRVSNERYVHSSANLLCCQIDAPINGGNSGGPVISNGKIAGIAMMNGWGENEGFMVPAPIIRHFLEDVKDGRYDGFPHLAIQTQAMENPSMQAYYGLDDEQSGVLVRKVYPSSPVEGLLKPGDVILTINGYDVGNDGTVAFRDGERTSYLFAVQEKQIGESTQIRILRKGRRQEFSIRLSIPSGGQLLVPSEQYDVEPVYYIYGGFVFSPLTENFLLEFGSEWYYDAPPNLLYAAWYGEPSRNKKEVVIIVAVLSDEVNMGYEDMYWEIVEKVNGYKIGSMDDLVQAIESNRSAFHVIEIDQGNQIVLDRREADKSKRRILKQYRISADRSGNLKPEIISRGR
jgi:S1-C subfamily serine protease